MGLPPPPYFFPKKRRQGGGTNWLPVILFSTQNWIVSWWRNKMSEEENYNRSSKSEDYINVKYTISRTALSLSPTGRDWKFHSQKETLLIKSLTLFSTQSFLELGYTLFILMFLSCVCFSSFLYGYSLFNFELSFLLYFHFFFILFSQYLIHFIYNLFLVNFLFSFFQFFIFVGFQKVEEIKCK